VAGVTETTRRERATPLPPEDRRQAIIDAVVPLLVEHGPAVTTRQIAEAAGVAEGTLFRVFPDKKALLMAAVQHVIDAERDERALVSKLRGAADLEAKVVAAIDHLRARMEQIMVVLTALRHVVLTEEKAYEGPHTPPEFMREADRRLLDAIATHVFAPHRDELRVDPLEAAMVLRAIVFGMWHPMGAAPKEISTRQTATLLLEGLTRT
jgi:AcrR family transcriptional regulator